MSTLKYLSLLLITISLLSSCDDYNQTLVIDADGSTRFSAGTNLYGLYGFSDLMGDSTEEAAPDTDPTYTLGTVQDMESLPEVIDTTVYLSQDPNAQMLSAADQALLSLVAVHFDIDKPNEKMNFDMLMNYETLEQRTAIFEAIARLQALEEEPTEEQDGPSVDDVEANMIPYEIDLAKGIFIVKDSEASEDLMSNLDAGEDDEEEMSEADLAMLSAMMPGSINYTVTLPGKVRSVTGLPYTLINDNTVKVSYKYADLIRDETIKGFEVRFDPTEPITDPTFTEVWEPEPTVVTPGKNNVGPPSDAIVLLGGKDGSAWTHLDGRPIEWKLSKKEMTVTPGTGNIVTKEVFGDVQLHLEWKSPKEPSATGQGKGNSGIFLQGKYEVQILNSYQNRTYSNGQAASVYKQYAPLANATRPTGEWNVYDIIFHAPVFDDEGSQLKKGTVTVIHNGVIVQNHVEIQGTTEYIGYPKTIAHRDGPIILQDHSNKVSYRNIWLRKL